MGFSTQGLIVGLAVLVPNVLLVLFPPRTPMPAVQVPGPLQWLERAGQSLCLVVPAITRQGESVGWWAIAVIAGLTGYYALWARYLLAGRRGEMLYRAWWVIPVPMAILPVVVFLSASAWLGNPWIAAAAVVLAAGHIPASMIIARGLRTIPGGPSS